MITRLFILITAVVSSGLKYAVSENIIDANDEKTSMPFFGILDNNEGNYTVDLPAIYDYEDYIDLPPINDTLPAMKSRQFDEVSNSSEICTDKTCVYKCCPEGQIYFFNELGCVDATEDEPEIDFKFHHKDGRLAVPDKELLLVHGLPSTCSITYGPMLAKRSGLILPDGRLFTAYDKQYRQPTEFCTDVIRNLNMSGIGTYSVQSIIFCLEYKVPTTRELFRRYAHSTCLFLSILALAFLIFCHVAIPDLRNLPGLCLLSHASSLLLAFVMLFTTHVWKQIPGPPCIAFGLILYSSYIATYSWLTVMCYDIWNYTRKSVKGIPYSRMGNKHQFLIYSFVVWGFLAIIITVVSTLQFLPKDMVPDYILTPGIGITRCFLIEEDANLLVYYFGILGFLSLMCLSLVTSTIFYLKKGGAKICCGGKEELHPESSVFNANNVDTFWQRFQIFVVTIIIWSTEVLSWKIPPEEMWEFTDILNTLQGVIILTIFLRQEKKRKLVVDLLRNISGNAQEAARKIFTTNDTSSSFLSSKLENSDKETVERIRKLSKQEVTAAEMMVKSLNDIDMKEIKSKNTADEK